MKSCIRALLLFCIMVILVSCTGAGTMKFDAVQYIFGDDSKVVINNVDTPLVVSSGLLTLNTKDLKINVTVIPMAYFMGYNFNFNVVNTSNSTVYIHWKDALIIDQLGRTHTVGTTGVRFADMTKGGQVDAMLPRGSTGNYTIIKSDTLKFEPTYSSAEWTYEGTLSPARDYITEEEINKMCSGILVADKTNCFYVLRERAKMADMLTKGGAVRVFVPITENGKRSEYDFVITFKSSRIYDGKAF